MSDFWAVSIPAGIGLAGVVLTQARADHRADNREREASVREDERDKVARQREVADRLFEDRKAAYIAVLAALRERVNETGQFVAGFAPPKEDDLPEEENVRRVVAHLNRVGKDAGFMALLEEFDRSMNLFIGRASELELLASSDAIELMWKLQDLLHHFFVVSDSAVAHLARRKVLFDTLDDFRQAARADLGADASPTL
jgi:hypothetical protein